MRTFIFLVFTTALIIYLFAIYKWYIEAAPEFKMTRFTKFRIKTITDKEQKKFVVQYKNYLKWYDKDIVLNEQEAISIITKLINSYVEEQHKTTFSSEVSVQQLLKNKK